MGSTHILERKMMLKRRIPSLVELCIQKAIDNVRYLGDVGETDIHLLKDVLPHCTVDQLMHIEKSSEGRDLSPVTDNLWKKFYEKQFGAKNASLVIERMKQNKVSFKWIQLYEAKLEDWDEAQKKSVDRLKQLYEKEVVSSGSCNNFSNLKGNLMKKSKMEYLNSHEARVHADMRKNALQRSRSAPHIMKPSGFPRKDSASSSFTKPFQRK
ncbi:hypothetical protein HHK36_003634 [Tetracentron sinense]|uniref:Elongin-A n=1 Tax=Tetracentron sinense TaxID=13715 RepID=A0A834ZPE2_TETSI|nr:hypothetical protein HHK36_003634 [Tetracentron sinense]